MKTRGLRDIAVRITQSAGETPEIVRGGIINSDDSNTVLILSCIRRAVIQVLDAHQWASTIKAVPEVIITNSTSSYTLPNDFWELYTGSLKSNGVARVDLKSYNFHFIPETKKMTVDFLYTNLPDISIQYKYVSGYVISSADGLTLKDDFTLDTDHCILDADLIEYYASFLYKTHKQVGNPQGDYIKYKETESIRTGSQRSHTVII
jgi:hypothetical protein